MKQHYPNLKTMQNDLGITYAQAKEVKDMMKADKSAGDVMMTAARYMGIDHNDYPYHPIGRLYESTGLYHIDADILLGPVKTLIHDRCGGSWYVMTEKEYKDMEVSVAGYNA